VAGRWSDPGLGGCDLVHPNKFKVLSVVASLIVAIPKCFDFKFITRYSIAINRSILLSDTENFIEFSSPALYSFATV